jgi:actin-related protein
MAHLSIMRSDIDIRRDVYANMVLAGGTSMLPSLNDRLAKKIVSLASDTKKVESIAPSDREYSV